MLLVVGNLVMVGDFEGYLYFVVCDSGKMLVCMEMDGFVIVIVLVLLDGIVLVVIFKGGLYVIKL